MARGRRVEHLSRGLEPRAQPIYQPRIENQLNDVALLRQFILLRTEPCQPLNHHWEQREDSNLHAPMRVFKKPKLVARRLNSISASSLASDVLRGAFLNDIKDIRTPRLEMVVRVGLAPTVFLMWRVYSPLRSLLSHLTFKIFGWSDGTRTRVSRIKSSLQDHFATLQ